MEKRVRVNGVLRGNEGEMRHVCWQCPECMSWYSDDFDSSLTNPYEASCGWTRKHTPEDQVDVLVHRFVESKED